jgi:hypothetical protein
MISDVYNPLPYVRWADVSLKLMPGSWKWVSGLGAHREKEGSLKIPNYYLGPQRSLRTIKHATIWPRRPRN